LGGGVAVCARVLLETAATTTMDSNTSLIFDTQASLLLNAVSAISRLAALTVRFLVHPGAFVGLMTPNYAAGGCSQQTMMPGKMASSSTNGCPLKASLGISGAHNSNQAKERENSNISFHWDLLKGARLGPPLVIALRWKCRARPVKAASFYAESSAPRLRDARSRRPFASALCCRKAASLITTCLICSLGHCGITWPFDIGSAG
jgi:hypothetical protein